MNETIKNRGPSVVMAGAGINLALGFFYAWSIFKDAIAKSIEEGAPGGFSWDPAVLNDPYAVACLVFALGMVPAGKVQDSKGPAFCATVGGILVSIGMLILYSSTSYGAWVFGFGILVGLGIAFGYSSATPAAIKWFPPNKTGMVAGIVVGGFGLAPVYISPLAKFLLGTYGVQNTMLFFGIAFLIVVTILARLLVNPPPGYTPGGFVDRRAQSGPGAAARAAFKPVNLSPSEVLQRGNFWLLWFLFFIGAGAGLMVIGSVSGMAKSSLGANAFLAVVLLAVGNAGGRVVAGTLCDRIGPKKTLAICFSFQAILMFLSIWFVAGDNPSAVMLVIIAALIGFNYGANLSIFPSFAKDLWGVKSFGVNYGAVYTAWGIGGAVFSKLSQYLVTSSGSYQSSFAVAGILLVIGTCLSFLIKDKVFEQRQEIAAQTSG